MPCGGTFAHRRATPACLPPPDSRRWIVIAAPPRLLVGGGHFRPVGGMLGGGDDGDPGCRRPPTCGGSGGGEFLTARRLRLARHLLCAVEASFRAAAPRVAKTEVEAGYSEAFLRRPDGILRGGERDRVKGRHWLRGRRALQCGLRNRAACETDII